MFVSACISIICVVIVVSAAVDARFADVKVDSKSRNVDSSEIVVRGGSSGTVLVTVCVHLESLSGVTAPNLHVILCDDNIVCVCCDDIVCVKLVRK